MTRAAITPITPVGPYPITPITAGSATVTLTAADATNFNSAAFGTSPELLVLVQNTHATNAYTCTFTSSLDGLNRSGDITAYSLAAGEFAIFRFQRNGWRQADKLLYCAGSNAAVKFLIIPR